MKELPEKWNANVTYELIRKLGSGGGGTAYEAKMVSPDGVEPFVVLKTAKRGDPASIDALRDEARLLSRMAGHRNIIGLRGYHSYAIEGEAFPVLALEHGGVSLLQLLESREGRRLEPGLAVFIALEICAGLAHAHRHGIIHRDIKPANIMIGPFGDVKLIDFGVAKADDRLQFTTGNKVKGTPSYLSPEAIQCEPLDGRADLWAVGVLLFEMIMGHPPWIPKGVNSQDIWRINLVTRILTEKPQPLTLELAGETLAAVIHKLLEKDREKRFEDATETIRALNRIRGLSPHIALFELGQLARAADGRLTRDLSPGPLAITVPIDKDKRARPKLVALVMPEAPYEDTMSSTELHHTSDSGRDLARVRQSDSRAYVDPDTTDAFPAVRVRKRVPRIVAVGVAAIAMLAGGALAFQSPKTPQGVVALTGASAKDEPASAKDEPATRRAAPPLRSAQALAPSDLGARAALDVPTLPELGRARSTEAKTVASAPQDLQLEATDVTPSRMPKNTPKSVSSFADPVGSRPAPAKLASLTVVVVPAGSYVSLDGGKAVRAPAEFDGIRAGQHVIRAGREIGALSKVERVKLTSGTNELRIVLTSTSQFATNPFAK